MQEKLYLGNKFYDPGISQIHKINPKSVQNFSTYTRVYTIVKRGVINKF